MAVEKIKNWKKDGKQWIIHCSKQNYIDPFSKLFTIIKKIPLVLTILIDEKLAAGIKTKTNIFISFS